MSAIKIQRLALPKGVNLKCEICGEPVEFRCSECPTYYWYGTDNMASSRYILIDRLEQRRRSVLSTREHFETDWYGVLHEIHQDVSELREVSKRVGTEKDRQQREKELISIRHKILEISRATAQKFVVQGRYVLAIAGALQALKMSEALYGSDSMEVVSSQLLLAEVHLGLQRLQSAEELLTLVNWSLFKHPEAGQRMRPHLYRNIGRLHSAQQRHDEALNAFALAAQAFRESKKSHNCAMRFYAKVCDIYIKWFDAAYIRSSQRGDTQTSAGDRHLGQGAAVYNVVVSSVISIVLTGCWHVARAPADEIEIQEAIEIMHHIHQQTEQTLGRDHRCTNGARAALGLLQAHVKEFGPAVANLEAEVLAAPREEDYAGASQEERLGKELLAFFGIETTSSPADLDFLEDLVDESYQSLVAEDADGKIIGFVALNHSPRLLTSEIQTKEESLSSFLYKWPEWLQATYSINGVGCLSGTATDRPRGTLTSSGRCERDTAQSTATLRSDEPLITPSNTLWIGFLVYSSTTANAVLASMVEATFASAFELRNLAVFNRTDYLTESPALLPKLFDTFTPLTPQQICPKEAGALTVHFCTRDDCIKPLKIRPAEVEDYDDLVKVFDSATELRPADYGEFFLAELIGGQDDRNKCLAAEADGFAVGLASFTTDIDINFLNNCFELENYDFLVDREYMNKIRTTRVPQLHELNQVLDIKEALMLIIWQVHFTDASLRSASAITIGQALSAFKVFMSIDCLERQRVASFLLEKWEVLATLFAKAESNPGGGGGYGDIPSHRLGEVIPESDRDMYDSSVKLYQFWELLLTQPELCMPPEDISILLLCLHWWSDVPLYHPAADISKERLKSALQRLSRAALECFAMTYGTPGWLQKLPIDHKNAFAINIFGLDKQRHAQALELIVPAFSVFKDKDYCVILQPPSAPVLPFLRYFSPERKRQTSSSNQLLFLLHRQTLLTTPLFREMRETDVAAVLERAASVGLRLSQEAVMNAVEDPNANDSDGAASSCEDAIADSLAASQMGENETPEIATRPDSATATVSRRSSSNLDCPPERFVVVGVACGEAVAIAEVRIVHAAELQDMMLKYQLEPYILHYQKRKMQEVREVLEERRSRREATRKLRRVVAMDESEPDEEIEAKLSYDAFGGHAVIDVCLLDSAFQYHESLLLREAMRLTGAKLLHMVVEPKGFLFKDVTLLAPGGLPLVNRDVKPLLSQSTADYDEASEIRRLLLDLRVRVVDRRIHRIDRRNKLIYLDAGGRTDIIGASRRSGTRGEEGLSTENTSANDNHSGEGDLDSPVLPYDFLVLATGMQDAALQSIGLRSWGLQEIHMNSKSPTMMKHGDQTGAGRRKAPSPRALQRVNGCISSADPWLYDLLEESDKASLMHSVVLRLSRSSCLVTHAEPQDQEDEMLPVSEFVEGDPMESKCHDLLVNIGVTLLDGYTLRGVVPDGRGRLKSILLEDAGLEGTEKGVSEVAACSLSPRGVVAFKDEDDIVQSRRSFMDELADDWQSGGSDQRNVDSDMFEAIHRSGLVYDGRLVVNHRFLIGCYLAASVIRRLNPLFLSPRHPPASSPFFGDHLLDTRILRPPKEFLVPFASVEELFAAPTVEELQAYLNRPPDTGKERGDKSRLTCLPRFKFPLCVQGGLPGGLNFYRLSLQPSSHFPRAPSSPHSRSRSSSSDSAASVHRTARSRLLPAAADESGNEEEPEKNNDNRIATDTLELNWGDAIESNAGHAETWKHLLSVEGQITQIDLDALQRMRQFKYLGPTRLRLDAFFFLMGLPISFFSRVQEKRQGGDVADLMAFFSEDEHWFEALLHSRFCENNVKTTLPRKRRQTSLGQESCPRETGTSPPCARTERRRLHGQELHLKSVAQISMEVTLWTARNSARKQTSATVATLSQQENLFPNKDSLNKSVCKQTA
ncbi:hypothetical protein NCLIV_056000 [Neospora caninum Liverpool]|uniref:Cilia- and flagella-associated protein 61 N-terminal domain-containing protein n=1 Tax=Neospora caninum (strain Liverpool) TaxID=572307 RepID=F0VN79_NEOCL|nr:hypothetical protein NCLIV_056000 [Neospora caninum Liverpool]CBZ55175.1 hypothetical protein NCLIV_056000 [Neospora caninum Liverpool]|eukprot:XP_003885203.1 hypothetical protein NCLIV_056000 [Neospora caninum Liverpool]